MLESPFFEARVSGTSDTDEYRHQFSSKLEDRPIFGLQGSASPYETYSSSSRNEDFGGKASENYSREISSTITGNYIGLKCYLLPHVISIFLHCEAIVSVKLTTLYHSI